MPAEWEPHEATWIAWPHNATTGPAASRPIPWVYGEIVRKLSARGARPHPGARTPRRSSRRARILRKVGARPGRGRVLPRADRPRLDARLLARCSSRTARGEVALTSWRFNGWAKYDNWQQRRRGSGVRRASGSKLPVFDAGHGARRRQHRRQRRRAAADHRGVPAQPRAGAQSRPEPRARSSAGCASTWASRACSGWATASPATTRTATSTTWRASSRPTRWWWPSETDRADANYEPLRENAAHPARAPACAW